MAVYEDRSINLDGSGVFSMTFVVGVRKDGSRAIIFTEPKGSGGLKTRSVYDPATRVRVEIHDDLGIKTTWPGQITDFKSVIAPTCPQVTGGQTISVLGHNAVQDDHDETTGGRAPVFDGWRIPDLGCLRALTTFRDTKRDGSYARKGEDRLVWLWETDPPGSFFEVSPELEEVSPLEAFQRFTRAGLVSESAPVPIGAQLSDVAYAYWNGKIQRAQALTSMQQIQAKQVPGQP
jgi:hypothetical protein